MFQLREKLSPVWSEYNRFLNGAFFTDLDKFKGRSLVGNQYVSRVHRSRAYQIRSQYDHVINSLRNPSYFDFMKDNFVRLFCFNAIQRLIAAYQAAPSMIRDGRPNSMSFLFTEIMNEGAFRGTLKGVSMALLQTSAVLYPAVYLTNKSKSQNKHLTFVGTYTLFDLIMTPVQSIKNAMYAKTRSPITLTQALANPSGFYSGMIPKSIFNVFFASALYSTTQSDEPSYLWWGLTALLYPLSSLKVIKQASELPKTVRPSYRGLLPFLLLNYFVCWQMLGLYSDEKRQNKKKEVETRIKEYKGLHQD